MRALVISLVVAGLTVAGCSKSGPPKREAGNWKTEMKIVDIEVPGMDPKMKQVALSQALPPKTECLTKEAAAKEDPATEFTKDAGPAGCTFSKKDFAANVDVAATCKGADGKDTAVTMKGTFDSKKIELDVESNGPSPMGSGQMKSKLKITGTHIGAC